MKRITSGKSNWLILVVIFSLALFGCTKINSEQHSIDAPVLNFSGDDLVGDWLAVGPFPAVYSDESLEDGTKFNGLTLDYLIANGGESGVRLTPETTIDYKDKSGAVLSLKTSPATASALGTVDFAEMYNDAENKVAYAFAYLNSPTAQEAHILLGSDDAVKVWVNDEPVHENYIFRAVIPEEDRFTVSLQKGLNPVLVKVLNGVRGWGFNFKILSSENWARFEEDEAVTNATKAFANTKIVPDWYNPWDVSFNPGEFPTLRWDHPLLAEQVIGKVPLKIRWFDEDLNEVSRADNPGRYGYVAECTSKDGKIIRRAGTLYCWPWDWMGWSEKPYAKLNPIASARFNKNIYKDHSEVIADNVGRMILLSTLKQEEGAILMSYLFELDQGKYKNDTFTTPLMAADEYHIQLQKKIGGVVYDGPGLKAPRLRRGNPAPVLRSGSPEEAGFKSGVVSAVREVCKEWFEVSQEPFITLVARNGIIVYHEATGSDASAVFTLDTATPMASTTKLITGVMFAQFMHQDLIGLDDPVGKYYPDFPLEGKKSLSLRHCFTHTSGLIGHESWGGVHNHRLENVVANQLEFLPIGEQSTYNGDGYNLAGRVMESVAGKSIFRLIQENLLTPLQMDNSVIHEDLAFSLQSTAGDIARVGQMLLNRGSYGDYEFFSPQVFDEILPKTLSQYYPGMDWDQGIGITWMEVNHPFAGQNGLPENQKILGKNTIGHGSATSAVLQVDLDNGLVITQTRRQGGAQYEEYLAKLLLAIEQNLEKS